MRECSLYSKQVFIVQPADSSCPVCALTHVVELVFSASFLVLFMLLIWLLHLRLIHPLPPVCFSLELGPYPREGPWLYLSGVCVCLAILLMRVVCSEHPGLRPEKNWYSQAWSAKCVELLHQCGHVPSPSIHPSWFV